MYLFIYLSIYLFIYLFIYSIILSLYCCCYSGAVLQKDQKREKIKVMSDKN